MFERWTERARQVVVLAQEEARGLQHNYIGTEHLLMGLLREREGLGASALREVGITEETVRAEIVRIVGRGEEVTSGQIPFTPRSKKVCELALREALSLGSNYIGTEHVLLGLVREDEGVATCILDGFDADPEKIRHTVIRSLTKGTNEARWREYLICKKRGHVGRNRLRTADSKELCQYCGTTFWAEWTVHESGAPSSPGQAQAA